MRLIDADALMDNIYVYPDHEHSIMEDFAERVEMQETVDAIEREKVKRQIERFRGYLDEDMISRIKHAIDSIGR